MKKIINLALLGFVLITTLYATGILSSEKEAAKQPAVSAQEASPAAASPRVIAYYFHTTNRCSNCMKFEAWGSESLETHFAQALKTGVIEWRVLNVEEPQNRHFIEDYRLHTKAIVLSRLQNGNEMEWKNLERIWELLKDKEAFTQYIASETQLYLYSGAES